MNNDWDNFKMLIAKALPIIQAEADSRDLADAEPVDAYWTEMRELADEFQAALEDRPESGPAPCIVYPTELPERPTCVWLRDGMKIGIERDGKAAWLRIEPAPIVTAQEGAKTDE